MKISIAITILILAAAAGLGWKDHQHLTKVSTSNAELTAEASGLGVSLDASKSESSFHLSKRANRAEQEAEAKAVALNIIAYAKEIEAIDGIGGQRHANFERRTMEITEQMMLLDISQLKIVLTELRATKDLSDALREEMIRSVIYTFASENPRAALALFTDSPDLFQDTNQAQMIPWIFSEWGKDDPMATLEWVRANETKHPDLVTEEAKTKMIEGIANKDPQLALKLMEEFGIKDSKPLISSMMESAKSSEERTSALNTLRGHLATIQDEKKRGEIAGQLSEIGRGIVEGSFEVGSKWITGSKLNDSELDAVMKGIIAHRLDHKNTAQWVEWMGKNLPEAKSRSQIDQLFGQWTKDDYQAAGKWLTTAPAGTTKNTAIRAYANVLSSYEPEAAVQWAMTLPADKDREATFKTIYKNWPKKDETSKAAAEAFKEQHGIP
jgi:hypothetical protein